MEEEHLSETICTAREPAILHTRKLYMHIENPVYLSETKLTDQITVNMRVDGQEMWYPLVSWGAHWYESNNQWEVILEEGG